MEGDAEHGKRQEVIPLDRPVSSPLMTDRGTDAIFDYS